MASRTIARAASGSGAGTAIGFISAPDVGARLAKGEAFGFFQFGGSDIITLYQADRFRLIGEVGMHYLQGQKIGERIAR